MAAQTMAAGKFGECAFRAEHAAPYAPSNRVLTITPGHHAPEQELRKQPQVGEDAGVLAGGTGMKARMISSARYSPPTVH